VRVQRVWMPNSGAESWTVLGDDHVPVAPVERWLAHLTVIERSPNTIKGYAHDLKDWFGFLQFRGLDWRRVQLEDLGGFYQFHARHGVDVGELLIGLRPGGRPGGSWRPLLEHLAKHQPQRRRTVKLQAPRRQPRVLTAGQVQAILDACDHLRDRLLFAVLLRQRHAHRRGAGPAPRGPGGRRAGGDRHPAGQRQPGPGKGGVARMIPVSAGCCGCTPTTCTANTASWTPTMCSSTSGADPMGSRWPIRRSMTWWAGCGGAPESGSSRTSSATPTRPGCYATAPAWKR
jgi:hypothetical protein